MGPLPPENDCPNMVDDIVLLEIFLKLPFGITPAKDCPNMVDNKSFTENLKKTIPIAIFNLNLNHPLSLFTLALHDLAAAV